MNYQNDLLEIEEFINESLCFEEYNEIDIDSCLSMFTSLTGEEYLDNRAEFIVQQVEVNNDLKSAFQKLATYCNHPISCQSCPVKNYCNCFILEKRASSTPELNMIDLFCGAGGLSLGFSQEGFLTALANDIEECCVDTYAHNHPETPRRCIVQGDISNLLNNLQSYTIGKKIDIIVGGPPCQGFSMANRQRLIDDPRNSLYKSYVEVVKQVHPPFFVMENVKGMLSVASQVVDDFLSIGYQVSYKILNAKDYGVPQNRERLIYIGNCIGANNESIFKEIETYSATIPDYVLCDALFGLRPLAALDQKNATDIGSTKSGKIIEKNLIKQTNAYIDLINQGRTIGVVCNHKARYNNPRDIEIFSRLMPGDKSNDPKIADIMPYSRRNAIFKDKYYKLIPNKICKTITAHMKFDCNMYIHPYQSRGLTPREAARIQSYPDDYFFRGAYTKTFMQIGNSVPPLLGRAIAHVIKKHISVE